MKNILKKVNKKWVKQTFFTILLLAIVIALYFEINVLVEKLDIADIDMTDSKLFSLTDESKEKIKGINEKLEIQLVNFDEYLYLSNVSNSVDVIKEYSKANNNITVEQISDSDETSPSIVLKYKDKTKNLSIDDLYTYEFSTETYNNESLDITEECITNAITEITTEKTKKIYLYVSHSTYKDYPEAYFSTLISKLEGELNEFDYADLLSTENIPNDCDCLVIPTLSEDISEKERDILINYINNGGNILILQESYAIINTDLPNFQSVIDLYGINFSDGIVMEGNVDNMLNSIPEFIIAEINKNSTIGKNLNQNSKILLVDSGKIDFKDEETLKSLNVSYEVIAQASDSAFLRKDLSNTDYSRLESDEDASNAI